MNSPSSRIGTIPLSPGIDTNLSFRAKYASLYSNYTCIARPLLLQISNDSQQTLKKKKTLSSWSLRSNKTKQKKDPSRQLKESWTSRKYGRTRFWIPPSLPPSLPSPSPLPPSVLLFVRPSVPFSLPASLPPCLASKLAPLPLGPFYLCLAIPARVPATRPLLFSLSFLYPRTSFPRSRSADDFLCATACSCSLHANLAQPPSPPSS